MMMRQVCMGLLGMVVLIAITAGAAHAGAKAVALGPADAPWLVYRQGPAPSRSYVEALYTPAGVNVVRDQVPDHIHHHGLMFSIAVDGVDFWAEIKGCGKEVSTAFKADDNRIDETLDWRDPGEKTLLSEQRRITVANDAKGPRVVTWESTLTLAPGRPAASLTGSHYFGLGMRFAESMDKVGEFFNASGQPGELVRGVERNVPADWCAYTVEAAGKKVTVAMFGAPDNPRNPATWFTMFDPFGYMSATLNLHKDPMTLAPDKPMKLRYAVALWDERVNPDQVSAAYNTWKNSLNGSN